MSYFFWVCFALTVSSSATFFAKCKVFPSVSRCVRSTDSRYLSLVFITIRNDNRFRSAGRSFSAVVRFDLGSRPVRPCSTKAPTRDGTLYDGLTKRACNSSTVPAGSGHPYAPNINSPPPARTAPPADPDPSSGAAAIAFRTALTYVFTSLGCSAAVRRSIKGWRRRGCCGVCAARES